MYSWYKCLRHTEGVLVRHSMRFISLMKSWWIGVFNCYWLNAGEYVYDFLILKSTFSHLGSVISWVGGRLRGSPISSFPARLEKPRLSYFCRTSLPWLWYRTFPSHLFILSWITCSLNHLWRTRIRILKHLILILHYAIFFSSGSHKKHFKNPTNSNWIIKLSLKVHRFGHRCVYNCSIHVSFTQ